MYRRQIWILVAIALFAGSVGGCGSDAAACVPITTEQRSAATLWNQVALGAVRRDFPAPTVHSRNLWHLSAVMWDSWAAHTPKATSYFGGQPAPASDNESERLERISETLSWAAYELLTDRYQRAIGGHHALIEFDTLMLDLCLDPTERPEPGSAGDLGIDIADSAIAFGLSDGAGVENQLTDPLYQPVNEPLDVFGQQSLADMADPNRWQPLQLEERSTQNDLDEESGVQQFIGAHWGSVTSFALPEADERGITIDPGPPPLLGTETEAEFLNAATEVVRYSRLLGEQGGAEVIELSPANKGNNLLGTNNGSGHAVNPVTDNVYAPNPVAHWDYGRSIAEYWADGPDSETPPGHWNLLAIKASNLLTPDGLRWQGRGPVLSRLEWDLRLFFTLNAALHDSAIAVWGSKRAYDYARPISMVRYLGARGSLPVESDVVEVVTAETAAPGGPHEGFTPGATVVRSWLTPPKDPAIHVAGVGWVHSSRWLPYQRPTFVSPAFAGYVSGHSGFSRAAADIMSAATGTDFFPGGMFTHTVKEGSLRHEDGPSTDVQLQWATYQDAADEAGESRLYGGIHVAADDFAGRIIGAEVAELTWREAQRYFPPNS